MKKEREDKKKTVVYVFYDIESVFNPEKDNMAQSYSLCYLPILANKLETIDEGNIQSFKDKVVV